jgi:uncharacterized protein (UPF0332 family)
MADPDGTFLSKATESLAGAKAELEVGRYSNSANRSYYAAFQAAIHAILAQGIRQPGSSGVWNRGWVHGEFNGRLVGRRHLYPSDLRSVLNENYNVRVQADYSHEAVSEIVALRAFRRAEVFVQAVVRGEARL